MKKLVHLFTTLAVLAGLLAGCTAPATASPASALPPSDASSGEAASSTTGAPVTIQFWNSFTGSDGEVLREIVNRYNEENAEGVTIEMDIMPGATLSEKLAPAIATGTAPALVLAPNSDVAMHAKNGTMISVDDFFEATNCNKDDFMPAVLESLQIEGEQIMIPMQWFTTYLYYNKDLFEAAGLDPELPPDTWVQVEEYASKITDSSKNVYGMGLCVSGGATWFNSLFLSNGGQLFSEDNSKSLLDSSENLASLTFIQNMANSGYTPKGNTGADLDNLMMADQLGMVINGPWMVAGLRENEINFGVAPMPSGTAGRSGVTESIGFCVPKGTSEEAKAAAYQFMAYWNTTEIGKEWSLRNGFPPYLKSVAADAEIQGDPIIKVFAEIETYGVTIGGGLSSLGQINGDVLFPMVENVIAGETVQTALTSANSQIDEILTAST